MLQTIAFSYEKVTKHYPVHFCITKFQIIFLCKRYGSLPVPVPYFLKVDNVFLIFTGFGISTKKKYGNYLNFLAGNVAMALNIFQRLSLQRIHLLYSIVGHRYF